MAVQPGIWCQRPAARSSLQIPERQRSHGRSGFDIAVCDGGRIRESNLAGRARIWGHSAEHGGGVAAFVLCAPRIGVARATTARGGEEPRAVRGPHIDPRIPIEAILLATYQPLTLKHRSAVGRPGLHIVARDIRSDGAVDVQLGARGALWCDGIVLVDVGPTSQPHRLVIDEGLHPRGRCGVARSPLPKRRNYRHPRAAPRRRRRPHPHRRRPPCRHRGASQNRGSCPRRCYRCTPRSRARSV